MMSEFKAADNRHLTYLCSFHISYSEIDTIIDII